MVTAAFLNINFDIDKRARRLIESTVSSERLERSRRYHFKEDTIRSLMSECLLKMYAHRRFGPAFSSISLIYNEYGKPLLKNHPDIHFNLSHSGNWVACALSDKPVGVDVEAKKKINLSLAKRFFSPEEYGFITENPEESNDRFFRIWVLKESYIKAIGMGLSCGLDTFCLIENGRISRQAIHKGGTKPMQLESRRIDERYWAGICYDSAFRSIDKLEFFDQEALLGYAASMQSAGLK
ncbi:MAG: 4'-phosphopantetheinyl transferase superfamily protein [Chitinivibrionales bacterium]|nr:4'-phosphopantetheinyl transferase superfamily protein [Chitinivibrionales bacterium]MBD3356267.1 4'-phosphopantetheinyl transferase superfamily protein [Chitinivibrionales bacterium]